MNFISYRSASQWQYSGVFFNVKTMRLLKLDASEEISLTDDLQNNIPPYAILSHTWGAEEVTFRDIRDGAARAKLGYRKLLFCGRQAARDRLGHFWVDTCCIDKSNSAELSEALISMFQWYQQAVKCYAFLEDVPSADASWHSAFEKSRWFTRGWTLQELIAPETVEFFAKDGHLLGTKTSLETQIYNITGIEISALRGGDLSEFTIEQRFAWAHLRQTTRMEDRAYCLLGIFNINMPPLYGEGSESAMRRLKREIAGLDVDGVEIRAAIGRWISPATHRRAHQAIERASGTCEWMFEVQAWLDWVSSSTATALWIHGEPGVGKTVLASAAIDKTIASTTTSGALVYFYCNARDSEQSSANGVVASLAQQLLLSLRQCTPDVIQDKYAAARRSGSVQDRPSLQDSNEMMMSLHECYGSVTYIIDGLDECPEEDRASIMDIVLGCLQFDKPRTRVLITSRKKSDIQARLGSYPQINVDATANSADLLQYVQQGLSKVIRQGRLLNGRVSDDLRLELEKRLSQDACGMFLWAKLQIPVLCLEPNERRVRVQLANLPKKLENQYNSMHRAIKDQEDDTVALAESILRCITFALRPLQFEELWTMVLIQDHHLMFEYDDLEPELAVRICHNFVQVDAQLGSLILLHTSAKQYLTKRFGNQESHASLASNCSSYLEKCFIDPTVAHVLERSRCVHEDLEPIEEEKNANDLLKDDLLKAIECFREQHKIFSALFKTYPLLEYSGTFWLRHANQGMTSFVLADHPWIFNDKSKVFTIWRNLNSIEGGLMFHVLGDLGSSDLRHQTPDRSPANMVQIAAYLDLRNLLNGMLGILSDAKYHHQALTAAACQGNEALVQAFILNEQALRAPGPLTALLAASSSRHVATVSFLLEFLKRPQHESYHICTTISTIGACLSFTEAMLYAVYSICGEQNDTWFEYDLIKTSVALTKSHRDNLDDRLRESLDEINLVVEEVFELPGWSPIMIASIRGNEMTIPLCMSQRNKTSDGLAPVECALAIAGLLGHQKFVGELLGQAPATLPRGRALCLAVFGGIEPIVDVLVTGALSEQVARIPNRDGPETVAGRVAGSGIVSAMKLLVSKGFDLFIVDAKGKTPLHHAVERGHDDMVKYLLQNISLEAIGAKDADGLTALDFASTNGFSHLTRLWDDPFQDLGASRKRKFSS